MNIKKTWINSKTYNSLKKAIIFSTLIFSNLWSAPVNPPHQQLPKKIPEKHIAPKRATVDFQFSNSRKDMIDLFHQKGGIKTINPADYYEDNKKLLEKLDIDNMDDFLDIYEGSDIMRYAIYTQLVPRSEVENINVLNIDVALKSRYSNYIYIKNILTLKNFNATFDKIVKNEEVQRKISIRKKREKLHPGQKYKPSPEKTNKKPKTHKDIKKWDYEEYYEEWVVKIPRREASRLLKEKNILLNSSEKKYDEVWNNKTVWRTCIHGVQKHTLDFLLKLPEFIASEFTDDILEYKPIVVTWLTEDWHADSKWTPSLDHPSGAKFDLSAKWIRWVILAKYFAEFWVTKFNYMYKDISINGFLCDIYIHDWWNGIHFDVLVK